VPNVPDIRVEYNECPQCGETFNALSDMGRVKYSPIDDRYLNVMICQSCGHLMEVNSDFQIRELDDADMETLGRHPAIIEARRRIARKKH
jgi:C4-type Zn-finger protein